MVRRIHVIVFALVVALIGFAGFPTTAQAGRIFYIDYDGGSNSNPGTKASPWKTHPFMQADSGCTVGENAPAYAHNAGDQFIFKGGVSWPAACFQMSIGVGGNSSAPDYYGVDTTWFAGGSFTSPKFDMAHAVPTGNHVIVATSAFPGYATFDGLEIANQAVHTTTVGQGDAYDFTAVTSSMPGVLIENGYIHDWVTNDDVSTQIGGTQHFAAGAIDDGMDRITLDHTTLDDSGGWLFAGTTQKFGGFGGACVNCRVVSNSTFRDGWAACFSLVSCHDNEMSGISQMLANCVGSSTCAANAHNVHTQVVEDDWGAIVGMEVYNNYIHDNPNAGVTIYVNYTSYVYNNVMKNNANGNINFGEPGGDHSYPAGLTGYAVNNTVDCSNGTSCFATDSKGALNGTVIRNNNISITNGSDILIVSSIASFVNGPNNYKMSTSEASAYGFVSGTKYQPTSSDSHVASAGANLSGACSAQLADLCQDTQGAAWYGGTYQTRPLDSTAWAIGAYVFGGQSAQSSKPNPPTDLTAVVQ